MFSKTALFTAFISLFVIIASASAVQAKCGDTQAQVQSEVDRSFSLLERFNANEAGGTANWVIEEAKAALKCAQSLGLNVETRQRELPKLAKLARLAYATRMLGYFRKYVNGDTAVRQGLYVSREAAIISTQDAIDSAKRNGVNFAKIAPLETSFIKLRLTLVKEKLSPA